MYTFERCAREEIRTAPKSAVSMRARMNFRMHEEEACPWPVTKAYGRCLFNHSNIRHARSTEQAYLPRSGMSPQIADITAFTAKSVIIVAFSVLFSSTYQGIKSNIVTPDVVTHNLRIVLIRRHHVISPITKYLPDGNITGKMNICRINMPNAAECIMLPYSSQSSLRYSSSGMMHMPVLPQRSTVHTNIIKYLPGYLLYTPQNRTATSCSFPVLVDYYSNMPKICVACMNIYVIIRPY